MPARLVELGFCTQDEFYRDRGKVSANRAMPFDARSTDGNKLKVEFELPYDKAEQVLSFLRDSLAIE